MKYLFKTALFCSILTILLFSCGTEEEIPEDNLTVTLSSNEVSLGQSVIFTANSFNQGDVTSDAQFFVNGNAIEGNTFAPSMENSNNEVYAQWEDLTSPTVTFSSVNNGTTGYTQKVLFEDYTGTWCGYCPGMANVLEIFQGFSDNVVPVAIHCDNDPIRYEFEDDLQQAYQATGLPQGRINRTSPLTFYVDENNIPDNCGTNQTYYENLITGFLNRSAPLGLAINSSFSGNNVNFQVRVGFAQNLSSAKLIVYLLEDGLVYEQTNYFSSNGNASCSYSSLPAHIPNYVHNHVLRKAYTDIFGDEIPSQQLTEGNVYSRDFNFPIPSEVQNISNLSLVAFVMDGDGTDVLNVQSVHVGDNKNFD